MILFSRVAVPIAFLLLTVSNATLLPGFDVEVVDVFWTEKVSSQATLGKFPKIEVAREDSKAIFAVKLVNEDNKPITAIRGRLTLPTGIRSLTGDKRAPKIPYDTTVPGGATFTLTYPVEILPEFDGRRYDCPLAIEFRTIDSQTVINNSLQVQLGLTGKTKLTLELNESLAPGTVSSSTILITNSGTATAANVRINLPGSLSATTAPGAPTLSVVGDKDFEISKLNPGASAELTTQLFASKLVTDNVQRLPVNLQYINGCNETVRLQTTLPVSLSSNRGKSLVAIDADQPVARLAAEQMIETSHSIRNVSGKKLTSGLIAIESLDPRLKVMSTAMFPFGELKPDEVFSFSPSLFASKELLARTSELQVAFEAQVDGRPRSERFKLPLYIEEDVRVLLQDTEIVEIGGVPHLTGRLLNQGVGSALFTEIELVESDVWKSDGNGKQYLGDLAENSPLPFSLPLDPDIDASGTVELTLRYLNSMREQQQYTLSTDVAAMSQIEETENASDPDTNIRPECLWLAGGLLGGLLLGILIRNGRRSQVADLIEQQRRALENDVEHPIESESTAAKI